MTDEVMGSEVAAPVAASDPLASIPVVPSVVPQGEAVQEVQPAGCGCSAGTADAPTQRYIYGLGNVDIRFATQGLQHEFHRALAAEDIAPQPAETDGQLLYKLLTKKPKAVAVIDADADAEETNKIYPHYLYLAQDACWVLFMGGMETYQLYARYDTDFTSLIRSLKLPVKTPPEEMDLVIGEGTPTPSSPQCASLHLPTVMLNRFMCISLTKFAEQIVKHWKDPTITECGTAEAKPEKMIPQLFLALAQAGDNLGATDEHRALNYLVVSYPYLYELSCQEFKKHNLFPTVQVHPSATFGSRKVMEVIFTFVNQQTNVPSRFFARVDVTDMYPFLVSPLQAYYSSTNPPPC